MDAYYAAVQRLESLVNLETPWRTSEKTLRDSLTQTKHLLRRLGHPERNLRFIHVTGTSGKGSVTNLIHDILLADGRKVASYSSPHTTTLLERYRVGNMLLDPAVLAQAISIVLAAYEVHIREHRHVMSYFELTTCVAFVAFTLAKVEWCVLEVGLGGRWDSTNVIPQKDVAVITNIDLDHTDILGNTREEIAQEKVGIITGRCAVISGEARPNIRTIITAAAAAKKSSVRFIDAPNRDHRLHNALIATAAAQAVGVPMEAIETALVKNIDLPCRFEVIQVSPLVIVDGAHNDAKMQSTARLLEGTFHGKVHVIFGCKKSKDAKAMLRALVKRADVIHTTRYSQGYGAPENPDTLLRLVPAVKRGQSFLFPKDALANVLATAKKGDTILITGSLYLAGELRTNWIDEASIIKKRSSQVTCQKPF